MVLANYNRLDSRFNSFSLSHVKHSVKMVTYFLAKFALSTLVTIWIEECSPCIVSFVVADLVA